MTRIHYRNDFMVQLRRTDSEGNIIPIPEHPWRAVLHTDANPLYNKVVAGYCDGRLTNAVIRDDSVIFVLDNHGLQPGRLMVDWHEAIPDDAFPDGARHVHCTYDTGVELVSGMGDGVTKAEVQVQLPYIWQSAYDMAVSQGYGGTMAEYIAAAAQLPTAVETATAVHDSVEELKGCADALTDVTQSVDASAKTLEMLLEDYREGKFALAEAMTGKIAQTSAQESLQAMAQKIEGYVTPYKMCDGMTFREYAGTTIPENIDTSNVTNMNCMFIRCSSLTTIPQLDTSNVTDMSDMFTYCSALTTIPQLDTSNVTNMNYMFYNCSSLTTIPQLDTSNVTNMNYMFNNCSSLTTIPQLDTSNVTDMSSMFNYCSALTTIPLLDTSNVTNMYGMFTYCSALTTIPQLDTSNVTNMSSMFYHCSSLTTIPQLDTSNVTNMYSMFNNCSSLTTIPQLDTSNVTDMKYMFYNCSALITIPQLDTSNVTDMYSMFNNCSSLTTIPQLDTSNVTNIYGMFYGCKALTTVRQIDMSKATNISRIFYMCGALVFALIKNIGKSTLKTLDFSSATAWGTGSDENRQSLIDSLVTYSHDRAAAGMATATIKLSTATKALLTDEEIAQITAKGFTIA